MKKILYILLLFSSISFGQQFVTADGTITAHTGTGSYLNIDEFPFSDADYLATDDNRTTTLEVSLPTFQKPSGNQIISVLWREAQADGNVAPSSGGSDSSYSAYMYQGGTLIATLATSRITNTSSFVTETYNLTPAQVTSITDYTDLRIRFDCVGGGGSPSSRRGVAISYLRILAGESSDDITVSLNTADATDFGTDTTPTLEFTGTDNEASKNLEYKISIMNAFDTGVVDNYETGADTDQFVGSNVLGMGQTFTGNGSNLYSVEFHFDKLSGTTGSVYCKIYAITGTYGSTSFPTGEPLAVSAPFDASTVTSTRAWHEFFFDGSFVLENTVKYAAVMIYTSPGLPTYFNLSSDTTSPSHSGNAFRLSTSTLVYDAFAGTDLYFRVNSLDPHLLKESLVDLGFENTENGGDTNPFNEDNIIGYTVQGGEALSDGTYYWRVQSKAPSGFNKYFRWSEIRSFTIDSGAEPPAERRIFNIN